MVLIGLCLVVGCARKPVLVITVGGLGFSQMGSVRKAIEKQCPQTEVRSAGFWDAYKADIPKMIRESRSDHLVLIGHSLGCQTITHAAKDEKKVDLLVLIEPAGGTVRPPKSVQRVLWYQRSNFSLIWGEKVAGATPTRIPGGHNDIAHSETLINGVVDAINAIEIKRGRKR